MDVSENSGTPKSSILIGFSIINHPFWGTPIFGNPHILSGQWFILTSLRTWAQEGESPKCSGKYIVIWCNLARICVYSIYSTYVETIASRLVLNHVPSMLIIWFQSPGSLRNDLEREIPHLSCLAWPICQPWQPENQNHDVLTSELESEQWRNTCMVV